MNQIQQKYHETKKSVTKKELPTVDRPSILWNVARSSTITIQAWFALLFL
jgi:hypothetical protein